MGATLVAVPVYAMLGSAASVDAVSHLLPNRLLGTTAIWLAACGAVAVLVNPGSIQDAFRAVLCALAVGAIGLLLAFIGSGLGLGDGQTRRAHRSLAGLARSTNTCCKSMHGNYSRRARRNPHAPHPPSRSEELHRIRSVPHCGRPDGLAPGRRLIGRHKHPDRAYSPQHLNPIQILRTP